MYSYIPKGWYDIKTTKFSALAKKDNATFGSQNTRAGIFNLLNK